MSERPRGATLTGRGRGAEVEGFAVREDSDLKGTPLYRWELGWEGRVEVTGGDPLLDLEGALVDPVETGLV